MLMQHMLYVTGVQCQKKVCYANLLCSVLMGYSRKLLNKIDNIKGSEGSYLSTTFES